MSTESILVVLRLCYINRVQLRLQLRDETALQLLPNFCCMLMGCNCIHLPPWTPRYLRRLLTTLATPARHARHARHPRHPSTPLDTARHPSTPLDTARHRSTPLMILTQQRCRPIGVRVRNQGCSSNQTWLAVLSSLSCSLSSSSSSCSSVAPLLMQQTWQYSGSPQVLHSTLYSGNESSHQ